MNAEKSIAGTKDLPNRFGSEGPACVTVLQTPSYSGEFFRQDSPRLR